MDSKARLITEGEMTIKGKNATGADIEITAPIRDLEVTVETDMTYRNSWSSFGSYYLDRQETTFSAKVDNYNIKAIPAPVVDRTARVEVAFYPEGVVWGDPTIGELRTAARKCGVDEDTQFSLIYERDEPRMGTIVFVEFRWAD